MNISRNRLVTLIVIAACCTIFLTIGSAFSKPYKALNGVESVKAVFDIRVKTPKALAIHLDLVNDTFEDPAVTAVKGERDFVVIFMGPAVKFISKQTKGDTAEDKIHLDTIAEMIPVLAENGIKLKVCMFAAAGHNVKADSIPPEIEQVENGWISSIGYQRQGYALIPDF